MRLGQTAILCACAAAAWPAPAVARPDDRPPVAIRVFAERVQAYVSLQRQIERALSEPTTPTPDVSQIATRQRLLAAQVATARKDARQGDIFAPSVATHLRGIIRKTFQGSGGRNMRRTIRDTDGVALIVPHINDVYPEELPVATMPPTLLRRLPMLPPELAYRIIASSLVLQDIQTNLVVDVLSDAIPSERR